VILPSLVFVYWTTDKAGDHETAINAITLAGSLLGQLIFGYLADRYGRRKLYGLELIVVIFGTLGLVQCSAGYNNQSMSILGWIMFWRFFVGLGIGAEYPLSAVITAESVFPLGQEYPNKMLIYCIDLLLDNPGPE
jgi:MFS transporter, PHS family, inorganic phosphate transporter